MNILDLFRGKKIKAPHIDLIEAANKDHDALLKEADLMARQAALETRIQVQTSIQRNRRKKARE